MNKQELDIKIEADRQATILKTTRPSWLLYLAGEDSGRRPALSLDNSNQPIKLRVVTDTNKLYYDDGP